MILWDNLTSTNWFGFGMANNTLVYNVSATSPLNHHGFQVAGVEVVKISARGLYVNNNAVLTSVPSTYLLKTDADTYYQAMDTCITLGGN